MANLVLTVIGICGILFLCGVIEVVRVWREVEEDETKGY